MTLNQSDIRAIAAATAADQAFGAVANEAAQNGTALAPQSWPSTTYSSIGVATAFAVTLAALGTTSNIPLPSVARPAVISRLELATGFDASAYQARDVQSDYDEIRHKAHLHEPLTVHQMARLFDQLSREPDEQEVRLDVEPGDYPII